MSRRNLILLHRGAAYEEDFADIARRVRAIEPTIMVFTAAGQNRTPLPELIWHYPTLTVSLTPDIELPIRRGRVFANRPIPKLEQQENFRRNGIPTPPAMSFRFGMKLDPILFGEHVILKPSDLGLTSRADGIHVLRRKHVEGLGPGDFPKDHPIRVSRNGYIVQKFVPTGTFSTTYRVSTFLGAVIDAAMHQSTIESPALDAPDAALLAGNFTHKAGRKVVFEAPDDVIELAIKVAKIFGTLPLLGIDVIRDVHTGRLFVLEINAGGNTWHYSSPMAAEWRKKHPELLRAMKEQFSAFDTVAAVLARHVAELAA